MKPQQSSLAVRWTNWAANLLVSGVIIVVGLVFGREILHWWYVDTAEVKTAAPSPPGTMPRGADDVARATAEADAGAEIQFGDWPLVFRHGAASAELPAALAQLQDECLRTARGAASPQTPPGPAELRLLEELTRAMPTSRAPGVGILFVRERPIPMAVVVSDEGDEVITSRRVLAWGILFPNRSEAGGKTADESQGLAWNWFTWRTAAGADSGRASSPGDSGSGKDGAAAVLPELPGGRRTLTIRLDSGELRVGYTGTASGLRWQEACTKWYFQRGWRAEGVWETGPRSWYGRFLHDDPPRRTQILIQEEPSGQVQAFLNMSPADSAQ